jgi:large subunit ribosomal protein L4
VLSAKASSGELVVVEQFGLTQPKTAEMARMLKALGVDSSALIVTAEPEVNVIVSAYNLPGIKTLPAALLNVVDILSHKFLVITIAGIHKAEQMWGRGQFAPQVIENASL